MRRPCHISRRITSVAPAQRLPQWNRLDRVPTLTTGTRRSKVKVTRSRYINDIFSVLFALTLTRSSADAKRPCDCSAGQFWPKYDCEMIFCCEPYRSIFNHCDVIGLLIYERISTGNSVLKGWVVSAKFSRIMRHSYREAALRICAPSVCLYLLSGLVTRRRKYVAMFGDSRW